MAKVSVPRVALDVIDSTVITEDGWFYRFTVPQGANIPRIDRSRDLYATVQPNNNDWLGTGNGHGWQRVQAKVGYGQTYRTVGAILGPGTATPHDLGAVPVSWEPVDPALVATPGTFVVTGSVTNGGLATATVTVDPADGQGAT